MLAWSVVRVHLQPDHRRRPRLRSEGLGGDVELAGVLAGDDPRQRVLGIPRPAQLLVDEESGPGAGAVSGFAQVIDVVDDDDGRTAQAREEEFEEELL